MMSPLDSKFGRLLLMMSIASISSCVATNDVVIEKKIQDPKELVIDGTRAPWVYEIEKRLRYRGFKIKRMFSQQKITERISDSVQRTYDEASTRYILYLQGYAPNSPMHRCVAGGYNFDYIDAELVDTQDNVAILHYSNGGHSEGCFPLSGSIFSDLVDAVVEAWR